MTDTIVTPNNIVCQGSIFGLPVYVGKTADSTDIDAVYTALTALGNHEARISKCGTFLWRHNVLTGENRQSRLRCGDYRECEDCRRVLAKELAERLRRGIPPDAVVADSGGTLAAVTLPLSWAMVAEEEAKRITRTYHRHGVLRIPQPNNLVWIAFPAGGEVGEPLEIDDIEAKLEVLLERVPTGKRISGSLGREPAPEVADREPIIAFATDAALDKHEVDSMTATARDGWDGLTPGDCGAEWESKITRLEELIRDTFERRGHKIVFMRRTWQPVSFKAYISPAIHGLSDTATDAVVASAVKLAADRATSDIIERLTR